ncbi:uracil-DNA glycosylase-like protein [Boletus reticuloceps]|uniref:Uracil-DNA glycosylase-like protein n=1 Tax=Boletus reticuloceps TaxID=495285 RepID=A0A8I2YWY2_9AGAM|nr:uracil-DNA glycosylase-like protein [Boletus reticuloceps]
MTSIISRKRVAVSAVASTSKKRKVEIEATALAPLHSYLSCTVLTLPSSTIAVTTTGAGGSTEDVSDIIENLERDTMGESWRTALEAEFTKPYLRKLKDFLISELKSHEVYPPGAFIQYKSSGLPVNPCMRQAGDIYSWSRLTPLDAVKAVVIGQARPSYSVFHCSNSPLIPRQDPYHNVGQAHGLSFSVLPPTKLPGSLKNIYKQLASDIPAFSPPKTGDLTPLAKAGVLWLNACLTVRAHKANSHAKKGWESFTDAVLNGVLNHANDTGRGVVFFAWGLPAQKTCERLRIDEFKPMSLNARSAHPSPLSAHRGFLGNGHFKRANEWLQENDRDVIDWAVLSTSTRPVATMSTTG